MRKVFVNRTLNLRQIKYIGLDMDHTLVRYTSQHFEELAHKVVLQKLIKKKSYPKEIESLPFEFDKMIRGLVIDKKNGNILKLNRYSGIRFSQHGMTPIDFKSQKKLYRSKYIDLGDSNYYAVDTIFSISPALLFGQLVDLKDTQFSKELPNYSQLADDILECLDEAHRDGSVKSIVRKNLDHFIIKEPEVVAGLERFKRHGKKIFVITNSEFDYTKVLLDACINPFLKDHKHWSELFEYVITLAHKPRFFYENLPFQKVDLNKGVLAETTEDLTPGIYQGGCAHHFTRALNLNGDEILYMGDHIYGDILRLKKDCNWRTGLVVDELHDEIKNNGKAEKVDLEINRLMKLKEPLESEHLKLTTSQVEGEQGLSSQIQSLQQQIQDIDAQVSENIEIHKSYFNKYWGEIMRIGNEESFFASQVERFACIYMSQISDLLEQSPRTYFRGFRRTLPHEEK